jgi:hypothetical protein
MLKSLEENATQGSTQHALFDLQEAFAQRRELSPPPEEMQLLPLRMWFVPQAE